MIRSAIIFFLVNYCAFLFSQELQFSREFIAMKKNNPVSILNYSPHYFYVLRYNKDVHDLTLERRSKPSAERLSFTPLKLDSVNAPWFNYENLDYMIYEYNSVVYFIFEKVLNNKREIFLKTIDTAGKASGFKLLAALEMSEGISGMDFKVNIMDENKLLLIAYNDYQNGSSNKTAHLFDLTTKEKIWTKKLPPENSRSGFSSSYTINKKGDLYYVLVQSELVGFKRKYIDHAQREIPVYFYPAIEVLCLKADNSSLKRTFLPIELLNGLHGITLYPGEESLSLFMHFSKGETPKSEKMFFLTEQWDNDMKNTKYSNIIPLSETIDKQLTYYDGTDYKTAAEKEFVSIESIALQDYVFELSDRRENTYYKELLFVSWNKQNGALEKQVLIPRKTCYFDDRSNIKNLGETNRIAFENSFFVSCLESKVNEALQPNDYYYKKFKKLRTSKNANLILYTLKGNEEITKKIIYRNEEEDYRPLNYHSDQNEFIFYFNMGKQERFAVLPLSQK